jgi:integrase
MPTGRISKTAVDKLVCPANKDREILWDDKVKGFGIAAFKSGAKVYIVQYRADGATRRFKIAKHGVLTAEQAREKATAFLGEIATGADPAGERRAIRQAPTLAEIAPLFVKHVRARRRPSTADSYDLALKLHVLPKLGKRRITEIRPVDLEKLHAEMVDRPAQANRTLAIVSSLWSWAEKRRMVAAGRNPARGVEKAEVDRRERFLTETELKRIGEVMARAEADGLPYAVDESGPNAKHAPKPEKRVRKLDPFALAALRLLLLTGARLREVLHAKWDWVDIERGMIFLPTSKTGRKTVYLSQAAVELIQGLPRVAGNPYLFPGEKEGKPRADLKKPWAAVCGAAGIEGVRLHDLRHSFASFGAGESLGLPIIGKLLGHTQTSTTARYSHLDADPMKRAANLIGEKITRALQGGAGDRKADKASQG